MCWYRPPTPESVKDSFSALWKLIFAVDAEVKEIILIGDTNCNLKYHRNGCTKCTKSIYSEFQFEQQIEEYTRVVKAEKVGVPHTSRTLINHFATNHPNNIVGANVLKLGMVDQYLTFAVRKINAKRLLDKHAKIVETVALEVMISNNFWTNCQPLIGKRLFPQLMATRISWPPFSIVLHQLY